MRRVIMGALVIATGAVCAAPALAADQTVNVGAAGDAFTPARVAVAPGETVTWTNSGAVEAHNVHFEDQPVAQPPTPSTAGFPVSRTFPAEGVYRYFCDAHGARGGVGMAGIVYVNASGVVPPEAQFTVTPASAVVGQAVAFDGSASRTGDSPIAKYEWDLDGDGSFETNTGTTPTTSRTYASEQRLDVKLQVTDSAGLSHVRIRPLLITAPPSDQPPNNPPPGPGPGPTPNPIQAPQPGPPLPSTPQPGPTATTASAAPGVSGYRLTNSTFRVSGKSTPTSASAAAKKHRSGTTLKYSLSKAGSAKIVIAKRGSKRATGTLKRKSRKGANSVAFSGRIGKRALKPGRYKATLTVTDSARHTSKAKSVSFTVVRR